MHSELFDSYNGSLDKDGTFQPSTNQGVFHNPFENGLCCFCDNQLMTFFGQDEKPWNFFSCIQLVFNEALTLTGILWWSKIEKVCNGQPKA